MLSQTEIFMNDTKLLGQLIKKSIYSKKHKNKYKEDSISLTCKIINEKHPEILQLACEHYGNTVYETLVSAYKSSKTRKKKQNRITKTLDNRKKKVKFNLP